MTTKYLVLMAFGMVGWGQQMHPKPFASQATSSVALTAKGDMETLAIANVTYEDAGGVPGRLAGELLLLRKTTTSKQVLGDIGEEAEVTLEAWPLGTDLKQKPIYTIHASGTGGETVENSLFVVSRGLEEVQWWSVYRLGTGAHLFDTYVPLLRFSTSKETYEAHSVGFEVSEGEQGKVIGTLTYASDTKVLHRYLLTADDASRAAELRSYADTTRSLAVSDELPPSSLKVMFRSTGLMSLTIPIAGENLDVLHAQLPAHLHLAGMK